MNQRVFIKMKKKLTNKEKIEILKTCVFAPASWKELEKDAKRIERRKSK